ncbi:isatin hydrolase-like [Mytilus edulis]|uniref:isatin hydrolase-like n=1 Tax=Mytilus edulis TaxID=6550 RepID=UPI0039EFA9A4
MLFVKALFVIAVTYACNECDLDFHVIDLTHTIGPMEVKFPDQPPWNFTILTRGFSRRAQIWLEYNYFGLSEHTLTHVDAPGHMNRNRARMHEVRIENLIGPAVIINVKRKVAMNPGYGLTIQDLLDWEARYGRIPCGAFVIMNNGWSRRYPYANRVFNTNNISDPSSFLFPAWTVEAADWLLSNRRVKAIGTDAPSPDLRSQPQRFPVHERIFRDSVLALEAVANLDNVPCRGATIFVPALKLYEGSGAPARMFATVPRRKCKRKAYQ